ncbi:hypothetical protein D910_04554 [Dendroctonus ponderosae]|uniref:ABC transporter domain-containing protein n=1 Tax=Dendroctonus ponderosae TaxID=77166 RepID=U4TZU2_DENPD|nr:hypothetical protein D910_04554 [Dendroctonus ponderosae]
MTVHSGEVLAVLGSKGSGKKALLDVISRRVQGPVRGQILLNNQPMTVCLFQQRCGYVTHKCDLIEGLTVEQTLYYTPTRLTGYLKKSKVKQVMADLALSQVSNRSSKTLASHKTSEFVERDNNSRKTAVVLLLDEPTWDLNPLNTYLVVSILSNAAKKYGSAVILTMEKPRSDVFPFLDRVLYLCLGDTVYAGGTRQMLEYFDAIEFPCPQLENPLMYYLCLSTVDRRSRERFLESNHQIAELVEKFKIEGGGYRKGTTIGPTPPEYKIPLLLGKIGSCGVAWTVYMRLLAATLSFKKSGLKQFGLRLFLVPLYFAILWLFYNRMGLFQHTFASRSGLILNSLAGVYFLGVLNTVVLYPTYRTRYFQESQEGLYGGTIFLITYNLLSIPFSFISCLGAGAIVYPLVGSFDNLLEYLFFSLILWACYIFAEQQTMATLMIVKDHLLAAIFNIYIICVCLTLSSGILRSIKGLQDWLFYLTYATQSRYAAAFLNRQVFLAGDLSKPLPFDQQHNCTNMNLIESSLLNGITNPYCRYASGQSFLSERYARDPGDNIFNGILDSDLNIGITFAFTLGMIVFNLFLYLVPLPAFVKAKFRE